MRKYFLTGLVILLPVAVTVWVILFVVRLLTKPFMGLMVALLQKTPFATEFGLHALSAICILIVLFLFTLGLGLIARRFFFRSLIKLGDRIMGRIPLVNKVYKTSKEIVSSLFSSKGQSLKQVVIFPFPNVESYCLGLIASDAPKTCSSAANDELISVFIPTTPNPMTGFLVMIPKNDIIHLKMTSEEAMKYVVSCAVIQPGGP